MPTDNMMTTPMALGMTPSKPSFFEWMRGKRTRDIELPNESGQVDPQLSSPDVMIQELANNPALRALREYGQAISKQQK